VYHQLEEDNRFMAYGWAPMGFSTGFINHLRVTPDVVALIMCHEVVHNLTLARHNTPANSLYDFSHREQDYFATYDCFIPFSLGSTSSQTRLAPPQLAEIPSNLQVRCQTQHRHPEVRLWVLHASLAASW
jgi:hypothetical protein